jgi:hypothetical protein
MWLVTTTIAAIITTGLWYKFPKYRFEIPSLMFWGAALMILVDHIFNFNGDIFIDPITDGLVENSLLLGFYMIIPVVISWLVILIVKKPKYD